MLSVAVITKDRPASLAACLRETLGRGFPEGRVELVVVDDGSEAGAASENRRCAEEWRSRGLRRLAFESNPAARNVAGARAQSLQAVAADADWVLAIDDDALLEPEGLSVLVKAGAAPDVGIVGPKIVFRSDPGRVFSGPNFVGRWTARYRSGEAGSRTDCDWVSTTCLLVRGSALRAVQGFHPGFVTCHEDVDFCLQVRRAGFRVVYEPSAVVRHDVEPGLMRPGRAYYLFRNKAVVIRRNFSGLRRWTALAFYAGPSFAANAVRVLRGGGRLGSFGDLLRAYRDGLLGVEGRRSGDG